MVSDLNEYAKNKLSCNADLIVFFYSLICLFSFGSWLNLSGTKQCGYIHKLIYIKLSKGRTKS